MAPESSVWWRRARRPAADLLGDRLQAGVVVTKHGHSMGDIPHCAIWEGGHEELPRDLRALGAAVYEIE